MSGSGRRRALLLSGLAGTLLCLGARGDDCRKVMNIVNFVRSLDPRMPRAEFVAALRGEVELNLKYGFPNTILLQYDALLDDEQLEIARRSDPDKTEFGVWIELCRPLLERCGMTWRSERGWDWDWHVNPGFLMAYAPAERKKLVDEIFAKFRETFGDYPKSVGSWLLDAPTMDYMVERYGVDGFCICREQDSTDAYGLRGGYSNGIYYPSKRNMLSAATDMSNAVESPVIRMLTPDPIYNYARPERWCEGYPFNRGCPTMEPWWESGSTPRIVDWYFRSYLFSPGLMNVSYMQTGQENVVGWKNICRSLPMQFEKLAALAKKGAIVVETMGDTARAFKRDHACNCPQTQVALEDWTGLGRKSVWYNCATYRANLVLQGDKAYFRDIHVMRDDYTEPFFSEPCKGWRALYFTPPVADEYLLRTNGVSGVLSLDGRYAGLSVTRGANDLLVAELKKKDGGQVWVKFGDGCAEIDGADLSFECPEDFRRNIRFADGKIGMRFDGYDYSIGCRAAFSRTPCGYRLTGPSIRLDFAK